MRVIIAVALEKELPQQFKTEFNHLWHRMAHLKSGAIIDWNNCPFIVVIVGVGRKAFDNVRWLIDQYHPYEIVNIGTAGSSVHSINDVFMVQSVTNGNTTYTNFAQTTLPINYHQFKLADCYCVNNFDSSITNCIVDMESFYVSKACEVSGTSYSIIKFITDSNNEQTIPDFNKHIQLFHDWFYHLLFNILSINWNSVAVIIPVYNRPDQLAVALQSVFDQSLQPNEIIVVDDGSTQPLDLPDDVQLIQLNKNYGVSTARNIGIKQCTSDWIAFLDSDDVWGPSHLNDLMDYLRANPLLRIAQSDETWVRNGMHVNKKKYHSKPDGWGFKQSLERCLVSPSAVILHQSMIDSFGCFNESLPVCEDYDLWLRMLRYRPIGFCKSNTMTKFAGHGDQLSFKFDAMDKFRIEILFDLYVKEAHPSFKLFIYQRIIYLVDILIYKKSVKVLEYNLFRKF